MKNFQKQKLLEKWLNELLQEERYFTHSTFTCSLIKLDTSQQAIIFVCFSFCQVSTHSSGAVVCVDTHETMSKASDNATFLAYSQVLQGCPGIMGCPSPPSVPLELLEARALKKSKYLNMDLERNPDEVMSEMYSINVSSQPWIAI